MINRSALLLKYKEPAIRWIKDADPSGGNVPIVSLDQANEERTVYLISDDDGDGPDAVHRWVRKNFKTLFEAELDGWYCDPDLWPKNLTFKLFQSWFDIECHTVLVDTVDGSIFDDET